MRVSIFNFLNFPTWCLFEYFTIGLGFVVDDCGMLSVAVTRGSCRLYHICKQRYISDGDNEVFNQFICAVIREQKPILVNSPSCNIAHWTKENNFRHRIRTQRYLLERSIKFVMIVHMTGSSVKIVVDSPYKRPKLFFTANILHLRQIDFWLQRGKSSWVEKN